MNLNKIVEYEAFARKVFNYYNGVINQFNAPAGIITERCELQSNNLMGYTKNPHVIHINIMPICRAGKFIDEFVRYYILDTVIHELFHCDQIIDYRKMGSSIEYRTYIERANYLMTATYILSHMEEIKNIFGVNTYLFKEHNLECIKKYSGYMYERRKFDDHIILLLKGLTASKFPREEAEIRNIINNSTGTIVLDVNDDRIYIKQGRFLNYIENINKFVYYNIYIYDALNFKMEINCQKDFVRIAIDMHGHDIMALIKEVSDDRHKQLRQVFY